MEYPGARQLGLPRAFDQSLVVPDPDAINTGQLCCHVAESLIQHKFFYTFICLPEIEQLVKYFPKIIGILIDPSTRQFLFLCPVFLSPLFPLRQL
jgi:hypothetical protein